PRHRRIQPPGNRVDAGNRGRDVEVASLQGADEAPRTAAMHLTDSILNDYIDDELAPAERTSVQSHLAACADCRALVAELRSLQAASRDLPPVEPPSSAWTRIEQALRDPRAVPASAPQVRRGFPRLQWLAAAAVLLIAAGLTFRYFGPTGPKPEADT